MNIMKQRLVNVFILGMFIFCILLGCRQRTEKEFAETEKGTEEAVETVKIAEDTGEKQTEEPTEIATGISAEESDIYQQMALFIQEGFRRYGIEGMYQAYFGPTEEEEEKFSCSILLEGEEELWKEVITYTADAERAWYVFEGEDERIFSKDPNMSAASEEFVRDVRENCRYEISIAGNTDLPFAAHYISEGGPIQRDGQKEIPDRIDSDVRPMLYTYQDERLNIDIVVEYPQVSLSDEERGEVVNEELKNAFFHDDYLEDSLFPGSKINTWIDRNYKITREDERYLSMRIYTNAFTRGSAHPGEWEHGITIDLQTGEVLHLEDVIGKERSVKSLLESGAFESLRSWMGQSTEDWIAELQLEEEEPLSDYDSHFYLTEDGIGFITSAWGCYNCLEAKFEDLVQ